MKTWLKAHPRVVAPFTLTHTSWMNLVEVRLSIIEREAIHRGSAKDLNAKIRTFITSWNQRSQPFMWTKIPEKVLHKANRKKT